MKNDRAVIGDNNPPSAIDLALEPFGDTITEAENWLDGEEVTTEGQMNAVDMLTKDMKAALKAVKVSEGDAKKPLHEAWKAEIARWKPTIDDMDRIIKGLVAAVAPFKAKLAAKKEAEKREAWDAANAARLEAERKAHEAAVSDIDALREAEAAKQAAIDAEKAAQVQSKDTVKGMRKVHKYEITDHRAALHFIAKNYRDDVTAFVDAWVLKNHKTTDIDGVVQSIEKEAF